MTTRVLVVDDDAETGRLLKRGLEQAGHAVVALPSAEKAIAALSEGDACAVITDLNMPGTSGIDLCREVVSRGQEIPVIVVTAFGSLETAILAIRAGAFDFVTKPFDIDAVALAVGRAIRHQELRREVRRLRAATAPVGSFPGLLGASSTMMRLYPLLERIAESDAAVLITGESGTGKEVVARAIHERGRRRAGPFVAVNCAAIPEALLESELFGHVAGAFTDAKRPRAGLFSEANGGTLLLDEIGDLPLSLQPKLLRALEDRRVRPVGGSVDVPFDVRVVAATHRDVETMMESGTFRADLYYRLAVITLGMPPLRARGQDVLLLAQHFVEKFAAASGRPVDGISSAAAGFLLAYSWPGNVRELANCMERAVALTSFDRILPEDLPERVRADPTSAAAEARHRDFLPLDAVEKNYILEVLRAVGGNRSAAAEALGLNRKTLYRKLAGWGHHGD